jgi:hypothetical protein
MAEDNILRSYGDVSRKESVMPLIEYLTAQETQLFNTFGKTKAIDTVHSTLLDSLDTPASAAVAEAADYTIGATTTPSRLANVVQIVAKSFAVSRTQQKIQHYHGENELTRQRTKAMKNWANSAEFDLVRSTLVSGVSGTIPKMEGLIAHISKSTNTTAHTSGTVWSASILKGLMKANLDNSNGDVATDLYMGSYLKDKTDDFTNKSNVVVNGSNEKVIVNAVDVFETGLGKVRVHFHRYVQQGSDATARVLALRPEKHEIAVLEETYEDTELARSGPYDKRAIVGSFTLATRNQDSNWFASGFKKD